MNLAQIIILSTTVFFIVALAVTMIYGLTTTK